MRVARRRFIRRAGVVPRTKSTSYRRSAQEPLFLASPYRAHIRSGHYSIVSPYRAHIRSAHARLRPAKEASRLFFLGAATPPNLRRGVSFGYFAAFLDSSCNAQELNSYGTLIMKSCVFCAR